jgi:hypothetical protein
MKRFMTTVTVLAILAIASSAFGQVQYGWTVSSSAADPNVNTGVATFGVTNLYLWLQCAEGDGMSAAEFDMAVTGFNVLAFTPLSGFLNAGTFPALLLAVGGCPGGPLLAGNMIAIDLPGNIAFAPSAANNILGTVDCVTPVPNLWPMDWRGYDNTGAPAPESRPEAYLCEIVSVDDESWGSIKSLYR